MLYQGVTMGLQNKMQQNLNHLQLSAVKESEVAQSWLFSTPWSPPGSSIHGIFQAKILEWVAISFSLLSALCSLEAKIRMVTEVTRGFPGGAAAKNPPAKARDSRDAGSIPGSGNPSGEGKATHSSIPAWKIPWRGAWWELQSMGSQRVGHNWATKGTHIHNQLWFHLAF